MHARYFGLDVSVTSAAFLVAIALLLQRGNPRFSQLSSTIFGLFYCGYLPCFWVKLRCGLAAPALHTSKIWFILDGECPFQDTCIRYFILKICSALVFCQSISLHSFQTKIGYVIEIIMLLVNYTSVSVVYKTIAKNIGNSNLNTEKFQD